MGGILDLHDFWNDVKGQTQMNRDVQMSDDKVERALCLELIQDNAVLEMFHFHVFFRLQWQRFIGKCDWMAWQIPDFQN